MKSKAGSTPLASYLPEAAASLEMRGAANSEQSLNFSFD